MFITCQAQEREGERRGGGERERDGEREFIRNFSMSYLSARIKLHVVIM